MRRERGPRPSLLSLLGPSRRGSPDHEVGRGKRGHGPEDVRVIDPVCGMSVVPGQSKGGKVTFEGREFHFCGVKCRDKFQADPPKYLALTPPTASPAAQAGTDYTCPMHPEIVRRGPGTCPICGMALEPRTVTAEEEANPELKDMTRRFWASVALSVPIFLIRMSEIWPGDPARHAIGGP